MAALKNPKWEIFAQELAKGKSANDSYVLAGYEENDGNARRLRCTEAVLKRIEELLAAREALHGQSTAKAIEKAALSKEWVLERLKENVERAMQAKAPLDDEGNVTGDYKYEGSVANRALELLGKELGMFIERSENGRPGEFDNLNDDALRQHLASEASELLKRIGGTEAPGHSPASRGAGRLN